MHFRLTLLFSISLLFATVSNAAMVRVVSVADARTIVVEDHGAQTKVTLAGIEITDARNAKMLLEWTLASSFVMLEAREGGALVYRSPDALLINRELVLRGFARATRAEILPQQQAAVTFLGTLDLGVPRQSTRVRSGTGNGSGRPARPSAPRRPRSRARNR